MDRNPDFYELFVNQSEVMDVADEVLRLAAFKPANSLELFPGTASHSLNLAYRGIRTSVVFDNSNMYTWVRDRWTQQGVLDKLNVELFNREIKRAKSQSDPVDPLFDLAFCANPDLFRKYRPFRSDLLAHFETIADNLRPGGCYVINYGDVPTHYPQQIKASKRSANNRIIKGTISFSNKKRDIGNNTMHSFMTLKAVHMKTDQDVISPVTADVVFGHYSPADYLQMAGQSGLTKAEAFLWGAVNPCDQITDSDAHVFLRFTK